MKIMNIKYSFARTVQVVQFEPVRVELTGEAEIEANDNIDECRKALRNSIVGAVNEDIKLLTGK